MPIKRSYRRRLAAPSAVALLLALAVAAAGQATTTPTRAIRSLVIGGTPTRSPDGLAVTVGGSFECAAGSVIGINVYVEQPGTAAFAQDRFPSTRGLKKGSAAAKAAASKRRCRGTSQTWSLRLAAHVRRPTTQTNAPATTTRTTPTPTPTSTTEKKTPAQPKTFKPGPVHICAVATSTRKGGTTDLRGYCTLATVR